jgi:hypothetical protein
MAKRTRWRVLALLVVGLMSLSAAAYACVCCGGAAAEGCTAYASEPTCQYTATSSGDAWGYGDWHVTVIHGDQTSTFDGHGPISAYPHVIAPGDQVIAQSIDGGTANVGTMASLGV